MIPMNVNVSEPTLSQFLAAHPGAVITTYSDIGILVLIVGLLALAAGYVAGARRRR